MAILRIRGLGSIVEDGLPGRPYGYDSGHGGRSVGQPKAPMDRMRHGAEAGQPPTLWIFTGISFAGKSVLARRLTAALPADRIDPDEVGRELGLGRAGEFLDDATWAAIHRRAEERA